MMDSRPQDNFVHYFPVLKYKDKSHSSKNDKHYILEYSYNLVRYRLAMFFQFHKLLVGVNTNSNDDPYIKLMKKMLDNPRHLYTIERNQYYFAKILSYHMVELKMTNSTSVPAHKRSLWSSQLQSLLKIVAPASSPVPALRINSLISRESGSEPQQRGTRRKLSPYSDKTVSPLDIEENGVSDSFDLAPDTVTGTETDLVTEDAFLRFPEAYRLSSDGKITSIEDVERSVTRIIEHFLYYYKKLEDVNPVVKISELEEYGDESKYKVLKQLIRGELCDVIRRFFEQNLLESKSWLWSWGKSPHQSLWKCILELTRKPARSTTDVKLNFAVETIENLCSNSNTSTHKPDSKNLDDLKLNAFICYSLNRGELHQYFSSLVSNRAIMERYFKRFSSRDILSRLLVSLEKLTKLPFHLDYTFALAQ
jgi:hypothetical protein